MSPSRDSAKGRAAKKSPGPHGFKAFGIHSTETEGSQIFSRLAAERSSDAAFSMESSQPDRLDPETAAKRILRHALDSSSAPGLTAPKVGQEESEFKSLGVTTQPLTQTNIVKFRQYVKGIPVYGSLVSVELGDGNECVSVNSNLATPTVKSHVAKISPQEALKKVAAKAGYGNKVPDTTPTLNYYFDRKGKWHLAYIVEDVRTRSDRKGAKGKKYAQMMPIVFDYVVDAMSGAIVAELPRTPSSMPSALGRALSAAVEEALDDLGALQAITIENLGTKKRLRDLELNIETYDFGFGDPEVESRKLPGVIVAPPWSPAAVSAHVNAAVVAKFLRQVLQRNNIDNKGGRLISSVNCVRKKDSGPGLREWLNAVWDPGASQMIYGQAMFNNKLRSLASSLDVVGHELFHGVTGATSRLEYIDETGALNESYSDIFGMLISNFAEPDIGKWNWLVGDGISSGRSAFRDFEDPTKFGQPKHMRDYVNTTRDNGGVHINSGIHNFAAHKVMTSKQNDGTLLFKPAELAAMFYLALTEEFSRQSTFSDSRRGVVLRTRSLFRNLPQAKLDERVSAVEAGFGAAGIN